MPYLFFVSHFLYVLERGGALKISRIGRAHVFTEDRHDDVAQAKDVAQGLLAFVDNSSWVRDGMRMQRYASLNKRQKVANHDASTTSR